MRACIDACIHYVPSVQPCCSAGRQEDVVRLHGTSKVLSTSTASSGAGVVGTVLTGLGTPETATALRESRTQLGSLVMRQK